MVKAKSQELIQLATERYIDAEERTILDARIAAFETTRMGVPHEEVEAWVNSWGTEQELPAPKARPI
jgi:predicted transcriptional regulator